MPGPHALFDQMLEGIQILDADFRYVYLNDVAAKHGQRSRDELLGRRMPEMYPGIEQTDVFRRMEACLRDRIPQQLLNEFTYPDGTTGWFDLRLTPVSEGVLIMSLDITEQRRAERALRALVGDLEEAGRRRGELLSMLAHELRNPLAAVRSGLHVLRSRQPQDQVATRAADAMERQIGHLSRYIDDLLDLNRVLAGKITLRRERLDAGRLIADTITDHSALFAEGGIAMRSELPEAPVWVMADEARLAQVVGNLFDNARRFTPRGGTVVVTLARGGDMATIDVRDNGVGVAPDALRHLFEPLFQEDRSLERAGGGIGIGLAAARGLVELHGGRISAASAGKDCGTAIRIELPSEPEPPVVEGPGAIARAEPNRRRVLIIEDNPDAAATLAMILDLWGYEVSTASTGVDGVNQAREQRPDIVLCDIGLPGMDGYAVARALRADDATRAARLIAVTGYGREDDQAKAVAAGFDLHLAKPVQPDYLRGRLEE